MADHSPAVQPLSIMGVSVTPFASGQEAIDYVAAAIRDHSQKCAVAINPEKIFHATRDPDLRAALSVFDVGICDGIGVAIAAWLLYGRRLRRCTGVDLFLELVRVACVEGCEMAGPPRRVACAVGPVNCPQPPG